MDQKSSDSGAKKTLDLAGPDELSCRATHYLGPFAALSGREIALSAVRFTMQNRSRKGLSLRSVNVDPLQKETDGTSVQTDFSVRLEEKDDFPVEVQPGDKLQFRLEGKGALPPGKYLSNLRITSNDAGPDRNIGLAVSVKAHWLWAMGFMFLGLMVLGVSAFLAGEATVRNRLADAQALRQRAHEFVDQNRPPQAERILVEQMDDALTATLEVLSEARALGIEDSRLNPANRSLTRARELFKDLRSRVKEGRAGSTEVASLEKQYQDLYTRTKALEMLLPAAKVPPEPDNASLAELVRAFQQNQWHKNFDTLLLAIDQGFGPHVLRAHLLLAAGEADRAQQLAVTIRRWLRRTARYLDQRAAMMLAWRMWSDEIVVRQQALALLLQRPDFPEQGRVEVRALMDKAQTILSKDRSLQAFRNAYSALQRAETVALEWQSKQVVEDIRAGVAAAMAKTSTEKIEKAIAGLAPGDGPEVRQQNILTILDLWQERVAACEVPERKDRMVKQVASLKSLDLGNNDKAALSAGFKELFNQWSAYQDVEINQAKQNVLGPLCAQLTASLHDQLHTSNESLLLLQPHLRTQTAEQALDRVRLQLQNIPQDAACIETAIDLHKTTNDVNAQLFTTMILISGGSPEARLAAAEHAQVADAIALARRLMTEPRPLAVNLRTTEDELFVKRQVALEIDNLHPDWGPGVRLEIDFGDGTPLLIKNAEQVRQEAIVTHRYTSPMRATVTVAARLGGDATSRQPMGDVVGEGQHSLNIMPSPISGAQAMAGLFLNLRFFLAVVIGFLVQTWRFYGQPCFGGQGKDYVEAFTIGFSVNFGIKGLASLLSATGGVGF